jgi:thiamine transport system substrate-binding protein
MKGRVLVWGALFWIVIGCVGLGREKLVVYTYTSFVSWGPAAALEEAFEARYDCDLEFVAAGGAKATLSRLLAEREAGGTGADVFMTEVNEVPRIADYDLFLPLSVEEIPNLAFVPEEFRIDQGLVPYEYGYITLTYDGEALAEEDLPADLAGLADPRYAGRLVCEDPRTSSTGFSFLLWTIARFGEEGYLDFWRSIGRTLLTVTSGWSEAWTLLTRGEASIAVSFSTDTAYGAMYGESLRYRAFAPGGEGYRTVYGVGIVRETDEPALAKAFVDLLLSVEIQELLPSTEVMFPANREAALPQEFQDYAIVPAVPLALPLALVAERAETWLHDWAVVIAAP